MAQMKPTPNIKFVPATEDDYNLIGNFLRKNFFPEEPLNNSLQQIPDLTDITFLSCLKEGLSVKAINLNANSDDNLVGVSVNQELSYVKSKENKNVNSPNVKKIHKLLSELDNKAKIWEKVNYENHLNIVTLSVKPDFRGMKIGQGLVEESLKLAKSRNLNHVTIECSSIFSARIALYFGFEVLAEIRYIDYLDENKEQVFKVKPPHVVIVKFYKKL